MELGKFSVSLAVKDIILSKSFYEKLGFSQIGGNLDMKYLIMQNGTNTIGLFEGMFDANILTFNPGWDDFGNPLDEFDDIREIQKNLKTNGLDLQKQADESTSGPASAVLIDPDGNQILIDQHV